MCCRPGAGGGTRWTAQAPQYREDRDEAHGRVRSTGSMCVRVSAVAVAGCNRHVSATLPMSAELPKMPCAVGNTGYASIISAMLLIAGILAFLPFLELFSADALHQGAERRSALILTPARVGPAVDASSRSQVQPETERNRLDTLLEEEYRKLRCLGTAIPKAKQRDMRYLNGSTFAKHMLAYRRQRLRIDAMLTARYMQLPPGLTRNDQPIANRCARLVVSMSTIPSRIASLGSVLRAMKWQRLQPDAIIIGIPPFSYRRRQMYDLPDELAADPLVKLVRLPMDYGPVSKLIAALLVEHDPQTCIITVDDDAEPADHIFRHLVTWASVMPGAAIAHGGWNVSCIAGTMPFTCPYSREGPVFIRQFVDAMCQPDWVLLYGEINCYAPVRDYPRAADVLMGTSTPLYRRSMFADDFMDIPIYTTLAGLQRLIENTTWGESPTMDAIREMAEDILETTTVSPEVRARLDRLQVPANMFMVDDVYISAYLAQKRIPRLIVPEMKAIHLPGALVPEKHESWRVIMPLPSPGSKYAGTTDALHVEESFNEANVGAVGFFNSIGWWNT